MFYVNKTLRSKAQPQRGHQFDGSLNIYYADNRFYNAETGTWLSPGSIKNGLNWYTYCENNPVTNVDPTGLWAQMSAVSMQEKYEGSQVITQEQFEKVQNLYESIMGVSGIGWKDTNLEELNKLLVQFGITDSNSVRHLLTQASVETGFGLYKKEILDMDIILGYDYAHKNGNQSIEDAVKFRGGGYLQITGRNNYQAFSDYLKEHGLYDPQIMGKGADYVGENYDWEVSMYFWTEISHANEYIESGSPTVLQISNLMAHGNINHSDTSPNGYQKKLQLYNEMEDIFN